MFPNASVTLLKGILCSGTGIALVLQKFVLQHWISLSESSDLRKSITPGYTVPRRLRGGGPETMIFIPELQEIPHDILKPNCVG